MSWKVGSEIIRHLGLLHATVMVSFVCGATAAQEFPEPPRPGEKIFDLAERYEEHFAKVGTGTGTGFKQYSRWLDFVAPRTTPSGDLVNITTLTFLRHHQEARSSEFAEARAAAMAAGIGTGSWSTWEAMANSARPSGGDLGEHHERFHGHRDRTDLPHLRHAAGS